jgi:predicted PhzF superfamily epimerase YddE/YHI9
VAREFNLSETAYIWKRQPEEDADDIDGKSSSSVHHYGIRYYTCNGTEVDLCGHATLASAAVLFQTLVCPSITFHSKLEQLIMTPAKYGNSKKMQVSMNFPQKEVFDADINRAVVVDMLQRHLPKVSDRIEANIVYAGVDQDGNDLLVEVTPELLQDIGHDDGDVVYSSLLDWEGYRRGVIICSLADDEVDFVSRFFGPKCGIPEDPVTGSASLCPGHPTLPKNWANPNSRPNNDRLGGTDHMHPRELSCHYTRISYHYPEWQLLDIKRDKEEGRKEGRK